MASCRPVRVFDRVLYQIVQYLIESASIPLDKGKGPLLPEDDPFFPCEGLRVPNDRVHQGPCGDRFKGDEGLVGSIELQHVADHPLHLVHVDADPFQILQAFFAQAGRSHPVQPGHHAPDHQQGGLEVVGDRIDETLQFLVLLLQIRRVTVELILHPGPLTHIPEHPIDTGGPSPVVDQNVRVHGHGKDLAVPPSQMDNVIFQEPVLPELLLEARPFGATGVEGSQLLPEQILRLLEPENSGPGAIQGHDLSLSTDSTDDVLHVVEQVPVVLFGGPQAILQALANRDIGDVCECPGALSFRIEAGRSSYEAGDLGTVPPRHLDLIAPQLPFHAVMDLLDEDLTVGLIEQLEGGGTHEVGHAIAQKLGHFLVGEKDAALGVEDPEAVVHRFNQAPVVGLRLSQLPALGLDLFLEFLHLLAPGLYPPPLPILPDAQKTERVRVSRRTDDAAAARCRPTRSPPHP